MEFLEKFKYKKNEFPDLDYDEEKITYGKLKMLEDLALYIDTMRESLTRNLVVNGANDCVTYEDLKERWKVKKDERPFSPIDEVDEEIIQKEKEI
jgi:hypothetical protein